jgi:elongator complex protein 3
MPNLLGATPESDREDFTRLWSGGYWPDELKIYPTQLLESAPLFDFWRRGEYQPYSTETLINLIANLKMTIPPICRLNRVVRDIPAHHIVAGSKRSSLRQDIQAELKRRGQRCRCVRCREIRSQQVEASDLRLDDFEYLPAYAHEHFLSFVTSNDLLAGYLRLSLPDQKLSETFAGVNESILETIPELRGAALIREVHVFGQALEVGSEQSGAAQHSGLGTRLIEKAAEIAATNGYDKLAVISAVGTRLYYEKRGFTRGALYMLRGL